jgi:hypothetical protein
MDHKVVFTADTDSTGRFRVVEQIFDVEEGELTVTLSLTLLAPSLMVAHCVLDMESGLGSANLAKRFSLEQGKQVNLGQWTLSKLHDRVVFAGETEPRFMDGRLRFEAHLAAK